MSAGDVTGEAYLVMDQNGGILRGFYDLTQATRFAEMRAAVVLIVTKLNDFRPPSTTLPPGWVH